VEVEAVVHGGGLGKPLATREAPTASFDKKLEHVGHVLEACGKEEVLAGICFFWTTTTQGFAC